MSMKNTSSARLPGARSYRFDTFNPRQMAIACFHARRTAAAALLLAATAGAGAQQIGDVSTAFQLLGPNHKIVVEAYDDPLVEGVTCYVSRARTGGIKGGLGLAEDRSEASIVCQATGPIQIPQPLRQQEEVFTERTSLLFKRLRVVRMVDAKRNTLVYMTYSDRVIEGSPQNSVTAVAVPHSTPIPLKK